MRCFNTATIHATCEDYRAGASIDLGYDEADLNAGKKVTCPSWSCGVRRAMWAARRTFCKSGATVPPMCVASRWQGGHFLGRGDAGRDVYHSTLVLIGKGVEWCYVVWRRGWAACFHPC